MEKQIMDSKYLLLLMWRSARFLILGAIVGAALGLAVSMIQTPAYEAKTQVLIMRFRKETNTDLLPLGEDQLVSTNIQLAKSKPVLDAASSQLGSKIEADHVQVSTIPNTLIVQIKVQDESPQRAAEIANILVQVLIEQNVELVSGRYQAFETSLNTQISQIENQINDLQSQIGQISEASITEQLTQVNEQIDQLKSELSVLEKDISKFPANLNDVQRVSLGEEQAHLEQLRSLLNLYQQIQTNLTFIGKPGQSGLSREDPRLANLQSTMDLYQQLYLSLVNSRETVNMDRMQNTPNLTQINPAVPPKDPVRPLPLLYILLGCVVGFFLSVAAILSVDHFDESLKTINQTEELLQLPVLGIVSDIYDPNKGFVLSQDLASPQAEAFHSLALNVEIASPKKSIHTLLVLNADPTENKTTIAVNLGIVNAQQGKRVILLDGDFKQPHLQGLFGIKEQANLVNLFEKDADLKSMGRSVDGVKGLTLIASGAMAEHLTSWQSGEKWQELLIKLQKQADLVIIDGPSVEATSAQILASKADAVLLLVKLGETRADLATSTLKKFQFVGAKVAGIVLYSTPSWTNHLQVFHWGRINEKGEHQKANNKLDGTTMPLS
jgi:capsular exopolysaccharide synthesis family protein